jgi:hypothetical protein
VNGEANPKMRKAPKEKKKAASMLARKLSPIIKLTNYQFTK